jgi:hypothetical protein
VNLKGGILAWKEANMPVIKEDPKQVTRSCIKQDFVLFRPQKD